MTPKEQLKAAVERVGGVYATLTLLAELVRERDLNGTVQQERLAERVARSLEQARDAV
jgi:hypothetical protein